MLPAMADPAAGAKSPSQADTVAEAPENLPPGPREPAPTVERPGPFTSGGAPVRPGSPADALTREQPGRYELRREFGRGGQAVVYLAYDRHIGRDLAFKQLLPQQLRSGRAEARFLREARVTGQLEHPSIV